MRWIVLCSLIIGCGRSNQAAPDAKPIDFNPDAAATEVITLCDRNGNGSIERDESRSSLPLQDSFTSFDANRDNALSRDEMVKRFMLYKTAVPTTVNLTVLIDGAALADGKITVTPAPYIAGLPTATATTDAFGRCATFTINGQASAGLPPGLYTFSIETDGQPKLSRGVEVLQDPRAGQANIELNFTGR